MDRIIYNSKLNGSIRAITSKSFAHRAIFCALLAKEESRLIINDLSQDIESSLNAIEKLGAKIIVNGNNYRIIPPKSYKDNIKINVSESGTSLRFLIPIIAILGLNAKIIRKGTLISRSNSVYFDLLPRHGVSIKENGDSILLSGKLRGFDFSVRGDISSQFISGLLIACGFTEDPIKINLLTHLESKPYVDMTIDVMEKFGVKVLFKENSYFSKEVLKSFLEVEGDWSNSLFFLGTGVEVLGLNKDSVQGDKMALNYLKTLSYENVSSRGYKLEKIGNEEKARILDAKDMPDTVPILAVFSALSKSHTKVINIKRLALKESNRIKSTIEMLERFGVKVIEDENSFSFYGIETLKGCEINSYNDHRIAMAAAIGATFADGPVIIKNSQSVEKSYKNFFEDFKSLGGRADVI